LDLEITTIHSFNGKEKTGRGKTEELLQGEREGYHLATSKENHKTEGEILSPGKWYPEEILPLSLSRALLSERK